MDRLTELSHVRRAYAKQIVVAARVADPRIEAVFSTTPREAFLGPGPWQVFRLPGVYEPTPDADPVHLYADHVVGLVADRGINNGQPSLHAVLLGIAAIQEGEHVVHVGAGSGYYSAMMAQLAGPTGRVTAIEFDPGLAVRARACLASYPTVRVLEGDGTALLIDAADVIYVNAGVTRPAATWLDALRREGRLLLPLTTDQNIRAFSPTAFDPQKVVRSGAFFLIRRRDGWYSARYLLPTGIIPAEGARDPESEAALALAFAQGGALTVTRLVRGSAPEDKCWLRGDGWCLVRDLPIATGPGRS